MTFTHALILRIPDQIRLEKKIKAEIPLLQKQQEGLAETLRESGVDVIYIDVPEGISSEFFNVDDTAVVINGTALMCQPRNPGALYFEIKTVLTDICWTLHECPEQYNGKKVYLEGSDVLFTGKEIFVGIRKHGTNMEGAMFLAKIFCDLNVIPIQLGDKAGPLKSYVSMASNNILSIGVGKEAQQILKKMEQEATFQYQVIKIEEEDCVNCLFVNGRIIFRKDKNEPKFVSLQSAGVELWALDVSELVKIGTPFSRYCLLFKEIRTSRAK
ncbi:unnamed protein product [Auanema sp. JU1783]|nr:unnamed protein product [Auanema sp. JU1783]